MVRQGLTLRLLLFLAAAFLPAAGGLLYVQYGLRRQFTTRATESVLNRAEMLSASVATRLGAAGDLAQIVTHLAATPAFNSNCGRGLEGLRASLDGYALLQIVDAKGVPICRSGVDGGAALADQVAGLRGVGLHTGRFLRASTGTPILPIIQPFSGASGPAFVIIGIDLDRLSQSFERFAASPGSRIDLADGQGTILLQAPANPQAIGRPQPDLTAGIVKPTTRISGNRAIATVPAAADGGVIASYSVSLPRLLSAIDRAMHSGARIAMACAILSLLLLVAITRRLIYVPSEALLLAAQRWGRGDLAARAVVPGPKNGEFSRLAAAFNGMAEALATRHRQLEDLNSSLEARVTDRTRSLSETNNRLLVEIAERERTDTALRRAQKLQAVGQLAGGVAHEFNNLLTTVLGALELLRVRLPLDQPAQRSLAAAVEAAQRGAKLTSQLLTFARRRRLMPVPVDLNAVISNMRELLEGSLGRSIMLELDLCADPWFALADQNEIEAAILNLALNARDAMDQGGRLRIASHNRRQPSPDSDVIELTVEDTGAGMSEEELARAMEPFFTTKPLGQGTGLGLSQVHGIVQQLGGELQITSSQGHGTKVALLLPRADELPHLMAPSACAPIPRSTHVLLVDDDDQVRQVASEMLSELGYTVTAVADGAAAVDLLRQPSCPFNAMVVDYAMPGLSGLEVIDQARGLRPELVTLLITGFMEIDETPGAPTLTPRQVLRKPFSLKDLAARINELSSQQAIELA